MKAILKILVQVLTIYLSFEPLSFGQCDDEVILDNKESSEPQVILRSQVSHCDATLMELELTIDDYGHETEWFLTTSDDISVAEGNSYDSKTTYIERVCLTNGSYKFEITDYYNDGICCAVGYGGYVVKLDGIVAFVGGDYKGGEIKTFTVGKESTFTVEEKTNSLPNGLGGGTHHRGENKESLQVKDQISETQNEASNETENVEGSHEGLSVNQTWYEEVAKAFIGINPKYGKGSGFIIHGEYDIRGSNFGVIPKSVDIPGDFCTCDCKAGDDGIGCVGWAGEALKYSSLLWVDPIDGRWTGQLQAYQNISTGLYFIGSDTRLYPGGPAIYNVACTSENCAGLFSAVLRQSNSKVSCAAGITDFKRGAKNGCAKRCAKSHTYTEWLIHCNKDKEDQTSNFSGWGV